MSRYDAILARDVEAHYGRSESIEDRVADELGTDCGANVEDGETCRQRWQSCAECDRAMSVAAPMVCDDDGEFAPAVLAYVDARSVRRAKRARMARELADDCDPDGYRGAA